MGLFCLCLGNGLRFGRQVPAKTSWLGRGAGGGEGVESVTLWLVGMSMRGMLPELDEPSSSDMDPAGNELRHASLLRQEAVNETDVMGW